MHAKQSNEFQYHNTEWKVSKYGVISGAYFPVFGLNTGKYGPEITPYLDTYHALEHSSIFISYAPSFILPSKLSLK